MRQHLWTAKKAPNPAHVDAMIRHFGGIHNGVYPVFEITNYRNVKQPGGSFIQKPGKELPGDGTVMEHIHQISFSRH